MAPPTRICGSCSARAAALAAPRQRGDVHGQRPEGRAARSPGTGTTCVSTDSGGCTLRAAVQAADNAGGSNTITLPAGHFKLTIGPSGTIPGVTSTTRPTAISTCWTPKRLTITGAGSAKTTIDANEIDRAFAVKHGASLSLSELTIQTAIRRRNLLETATAAGSTQTGRST